MAVWDDSVLKCADLIRKAHSIGVLTGAGISTSAGIPDFRGPKGLYVTKQYDADTIFDIEYFRRFPKPFFDFARDFISLEKKILPTATHHFLTELEHKGKLKGIVTQNIDALHHKAGSQKVLEMHGSFWESYCLTCRAKFGYDEMKNKVFEVDVPLCGCGGVIKPDIVFFGENVKYLEESFQLAQQSDLFLVIGTSCAVYPAAMVPEYTKSPVVIVSLGEVKLTTNNIVLSVQSDIDQFFKHVESALNHV